MISTLCRTYRIFTINLAQTLLAPGHKRLCAKSGAVTIISVNYVFLKSDLLFWKRKKKNFFVFFINRINNKWFASLASVQPHTLQDVLWMLSKMCRHLTKKNFKNRKLYIFKYFDTNFTASTKRHNSCNYCFMDLYTILYNKCL